MQPIKKIIDKTKNAEEESTDSIKKKVLADPKVNQFIKSNLETKKRSKKILIGIVENQKLFQMNLIFLRMNWKNFLKS